MKILYFDCFSGISGDMTLGALLDLGIDRELFLSELGKLNVDGFSIEISKVKKNGIAGTDVNVILHSDDDHDHHHYADGGVPPHSHTLHHVHRNLNDIEIIIDQSSLDQKVKELSKRMFLKVAEAEAKIHGTSIENIHFHEVGALDSIVDIVGTAICICLLNVDKIISSPVHDGAGFIKCQHGLIPIPAPATMEILRSASVPFYNTGIPKEMVTPTGAVIIAALAEEFGTMPEMKMESIGYGAGKRDMEIPNLLRVIAGETCSGPEAAGRLRDEEVTVIESNIDDMSGEIAGYVMGKLFEAGALDVFYTPIYMKKNRPAVKLTVICSEQKSEDLTDIILSETTTIGIRKYKTSRVCMERKMVDVSTPYGIVRVKVTGSNETQKYAPEYEDCRKIAEAENIPLREIYEMVLKCI